MKSAFTFIAIALVVIMWAPQQSNGETCGQVNTVDGLYCRLFPNGDKMELFNCQYNKSFKEVSIANCGGLIVGEVAKPCAPQQVCGQVNTVDGLYCRLFPNGDKMELFNCQYNKSFKQVGIANCSGLIVGEAAKPCVH